MTCFTKTIACCLSALAMIGSASAESSFTVDFKYTPTASAESNYESFKRTARKACNQEYRRTRPLSIRIHQIQACRAELLDLVVDRVDNPEIAALHGLDTPRPQWRRFAQN